MAEGSAHAPYNFVPFTGKKPYLRYASVAELPPHDRIDPSLRTGEIRVTLRAETPVFVSDGEKDADFYRGADGRPAIPGSTLRGLLRENMQILGFGLITPGEDLEDYSIFYREMAAARGSTGSPLKSTYQDTLGIETRRTPGGKSYSVPTKVRSGHLSCEKGQYLIRPTASPYLRISRSDPEAAKFGEGDARVVPVAYTAAGERIRRLVPADKAEPGMTLGSLLFTGRSVGKQRNHLYLFPPVDTAAPAEAVSEEDILSYRMDLEARQNSLKAYYDVDFWALPKEGESKPVFYADVGGHLYFGMSLFLRIGYPHSLAEGLPGVFRELLEGGTTLLDYPHAVLGFAAAGAGGEAYRSRVSVGDLPLVGTQTEQPAVRAILGGPKPSWYPGYSVDGKPYTDESFRLRGYKQYWLHDVTGSTVPEGKESVGSILRPLPTGSEFRGVIRFKNLAEDELGLLLWALRLEEGCFQTLGMGKPLGYGRMKLTVDAILEADWQALYGPDLGASPLRDTTEKLEDYIRGFDRYLCGKLYIKKPSKEAPSIRSQPEIQDFFFLKSSVRAGSEVSCMELKEYQNVRDPLPTVQSIRSGDDRSGGKSGNDRGRQAPSQAAAEEDPFEALRRKFGKL